MSGRRPFGVTLLLWLVLTLSVWGVLRLFGALRWWDVLYEFGAHLSPLYLSITGAGWLIAGAILLWSLWVGRRWAHWVIPLLIGLWLIEYWVERLFFQTARPNLPFALTASGILLIMTLTITFHASTKNFFIKSEEHE